MDLEGYDKLPANLRKKMFTGYKKQNSGQVAEIEGLNHPLVSGVRGAGLLLGVVLAAPVSATVTGALQRAGFLANPIQPDVVRLAPPLILTTEQADAFLAALPAALDAA